MVSPYDDVDFRQPLTKLKHQIESLEDMILQMNKMQFKFSEDFKRMDDTLLVVLSKMTAMQRDITALENEVYE